jgi:hypothetical protein
MFNIPFIKMGKLIFFLIILLLNYLYFFVYLKVIIINMYLILQLNRFFSNLFNVNFM